MGLVAALVVSTMASVGGDVTYAQPQTWDAPTMVEINDCATMAQELSQAYRAMADKGLNRDWQEKWVNCEVYPSDDAEAAPASLKF